jgi:hypothetical protein
LQKGPRKEPVSPSFEEIARKLIVGDSGGLGGPPLTDGVSDPLSIVHREMVRIPTSDSGFTRRRSGQKAENRRERNGMWIGGFAVSFVGCELPRSDSWSQAWQHGPTGRHGTVPETPEGSGPESTLLKALSQDTELYGHRRPKPLSPSGLSSAPFQGRGAGGRRRCPRFPRRRLPISSARR